MTQLTIDALTQTIQNESGQYQWMVPDTWQQGRGAFGGLVMAAIVRTLVHAVNDASMKPRSISATMSAPVLPGLAHIEVAIIRQGKNTITLTAILMQNGEIKNHATAIFGATRNVEDSHTRLLECPHKKDWKAFEIAPFSPFNPTFTQHMDFRAIKGFPLVGDKQATELEGWINAKHPGQTRDDAYTALLADAWWPVAFTRFTSPRPAATIHYTIQFQSDWKGLCSDAPLFHHAYSPITTEGYSVEFRQLWGEDGRLMALNQQTIVLIK